MNRTIQVSYEGPGEVLVTFIENGEVDTEEKFTTKAKAEARAEKLAKMYGCEWGANYF